MNIEQLDNRARIILKGSGLRRGKPLAISISSIHAHNISPKELRIGLHDLPTMGGRMTQEAAKSLV